VDPELEQLYAALKAAHAAGDTANAQKLADYIRQRAAAPAADAAPKPQQDAMVPANQRESGYRAALGLPKKEPTAAGVVDAATRGALPATTVATAGAAIGGALGGPAGAVGGAGLGLFGLGLTDLASGVWNSTAVPLFGAPRQMGGSEMILAGTDTVGLTKPVADDPNARMAFTAANLGSNAVGVNNIFRAGGAVLEAIPSVARATPAAVQTAPLASGVRNTAAAITEVPANIGNFFRQPITSTSLVAGGAGGGAVQQGLTEMGADPTVAMLGGMGTSVITGRFGSGPTIIPPRKVPARSADEIAAGANAQYTAAQNQGLVWTAANADEIARRAVDDAINGAHPGGAMSPAAVPAPMRDVLGRMVTQARTNGRLNAQDIETYRQQLAAAGRGLPTAGGYDKAARQILETFDNLVAQPGNTLNAVRSDVARTRTAVADAESRVMALDPADTVAVRAAEAEVDTARAAFENAQRVMRAQDPDMRAVVQAQETATTRHAAADTRRMDADKDYTAATSRQAALEQDAADALAAYEAARELYNGRNVAPLNIARRASKDAEAAAKAHKTDVADARTARDAAVTDEAAALAARDRADAAVDAEEATLAVADDVVQRMDARNDATARGRAAVPDQRRTREFENMPAAARAAAGTSGQQARALREQVRAFVRRDNGREFRQLPEATQRQLLKFINGGGLTQRTMDMFGHLAPGMHDRNLAAWLLGGVNAAATGGLVGPAVQAGIGLATRATGNAMAAAKFNQLRDAVSRGQNVNAFVPRQAGQRAANYMLNTTIQPDIRQ